MRQALDIHRQGFVFADAMHLVRREGCGAMIRFDRSIATLALQLNLPPDVMHL